ncbi:alpha/beta fold hydrolase [Novilysobacter spongiicola]|uniref:Pimeloyl-ACP methyl ester carboxylesterase n=1 Tax=Lysobacter spongiicola DSM 21749 TaxID=1122188 RepID=A0A1T4N2N3_9GAMM|nr:alpha/beta hydrolase [Lysobacter spongiicola]SJZ73376.1 Pimeloyl-ACP methyl ester carboxylesterase [Lysobacter spongiicola DSM 21749]
MKALASIATVLFALLAAPAQAAPALPGCGELCGKMRQVVQDLTRIETPGGVQDTYKARIGGIDQWINIRGHDRTNPVILFVHGGPASPAMPTAWQFQRPIEEYFTVVHYDQRAAGKTFRANDPEAVEDSIRIDRYVEDAIEVAEHVRERLGKDKLVLVGHSWGTIVATKAALERPDLFHAYVGIGQVINTRLNEKLSFEFGLAQARAEGNEAAIAEMESIAPYPGDEPITRERIIIARKWPQHYGGMTAYRAESPYYHRGPWLSPEYDADDVAAINDGNVFTLWRILPEFLEVDFTGVDRFPIPVVMFMGRHDYTTPSAPTAEWIEAVEAPYKRAVWFERSSHMVPWEEPGKTLVSLLEHVRPLAIEPAGGR